MQNVSELWEFTQRSRTRVPSSLRLRLVQDARLSVWLQRDRRLQDSYQGWCTPVDQLGLCRPIKKHSFHSWRKLSEGRRCQSSERSGAAGRGSEHGAGVSAFTSVRKQEGELKLLNLTNKVHDLMQITRLYTVFDITDDEALAVKSFGQSAAATG